MDSMTIGAGALAIIMIVIFLVSVTMMRGRDVVKLDRRRRQ